MKYIWILLFLIIASCFAPSQSNVITKFEIDFQDFFYNDKISLYVEDTVVLTNIFLTSDQIYGHTGITLQGFEERNKLKMSYKTIVKYCKLSKDNWINMRIILNEKSHRLKIDLKKGSYIGFDKLKKDSILVSQSFSPFEYD